jgi:hypothetical protein
MSMTHAAWKTLLGIDPGRSGGIACWKHDQPAIALKMPETEGDLIELFRTLIIPGETIAFVEEVGGYAGKRQPGSAMFKFGRNYGFTLGVLQTLDVRVELVRPQKWQKPLGLGKASHCRTRTEWKNRLKACAQRFFPKLKPTLSTADALLIMDFGLRALNAGGDPAKVKTARVNRGVLPSKSTRQRAEIEH